MFHPDVQAATSILLKQNTYEAHEALEQLLIPKLHAVHTPEDYINILKTFYGYFQPLEGLIEKHITEVQLPDVKSRRKASFLLNDLAALQHQDMELPLSRYLPSIKSDIDAWGALYVLEGSTLGGRGITRMLLKQCPKLSVNQLQFFNGYGAETGKRWQAFQLALNQSHYNDDQLAQLVTSANNTFLNFKVWIEQTLA